MPGGLGGLGRTLMLTGEAIFVLGVLLLPGQAEGRAAAGALAGALALELRLGCCSLPERANRAVPSLLEWVEG